MSEADIVDNVHNVYILPNVKAVHQLHWKMKHRLAHGKFIIHKIDGLSMHFVNDPSLVI